MPARYGPLSLPFAVNTPKALFRRAPLFFLLCLVWWVAGGLALATFGRDELFFAINGYRGPVLDPVFAFATHLGEGIFVGIVVLLCLCASYGWGILAATGFAATGLLSLVLKNVVYFKELRPFAFYKGTPFTVQTVDGTYLYLNNSFPSGHTITGFCLFTVLALLAGPKPWWGALCFLGALAVAYSRMYLGEHFFADVYAGSLVGGLATCALALLQNRTLAHRAWYGRSLLDRWKQNAR